MIILNLFILLIVCQVQAKTNEMSDLITAETAVAKKAITGASAIKAGKKGVLVAGGKKFGKGIIIKLIKKL